VALASAQLPLTQDVAFGHSELDLQEYVQTLFVQSLLVPDGVVEHAPQRRVPPQPSLTNPQFFPSDAHVTDRQVGSVGLMDWVGLCPACDEHAGSDRAAIIATGTRPRNVRPERRGTII
jgi:hypothetical protein